MNLKEKCDQLIKTWIETEDGSGNFKLSGVCWEILYPVLKKNSPELLKKYEDRLSIEFDVFNADIFDKLSTGIDDKDFENAVNYMNAREQSYATPDEVDYFDVGDDRVIPYIANQALDETKEFD